MIKYPEEIKATMWERMLRNERAKTQAFAIHRSSKEQAGPQEKTVVDIPVMAFPDKTSHDPAVVVGSKKTG